MSPKEKMRLTARHGKAWVTRLATRQKKVLRLRKAMRLGPTPVTVDGLVHEADCICHDCLYGEVAALRREAVHGRRLTKETGVAFTARTGRMMTSGSGMRRNFSYEG